MKLSKDFFFICQTESWVFAYFIVSQWFASIQQSEIVPRLIRPANLIRLVSLTRLQILIRLARLTKLMWILMQILMQVLIRLTRLSKLINLTRLKILISQMIFIKWTIFVRLMNSHERLLWAVFLLKMLIKQIIECKALLIRSANFYLWDKNINMISKIIFRIRFRLF